MPTPVTYTITLHLLGTCDATTTWIPVRLDDVVLLPKALRDGAFTMDFWNSTDFANAAADPDNEKVLVTNVLSPLNGLVVKRGQGGTMATAKTPGKDYVLTSQVSTPIVGNLDDLFLRISDYNPGGGGTPVFNETPIGAVNGINASFVLANTPLGAAIIVYKNGVYQSPATDYTLSIITITFVAGNIPQTGDIVRVFYFK